MKKSLSLGILLGITLIVAMGIVFIDSTQNYWYVNNGYVKLVVSNQTQQAIMSINTNSFGVGFNIDNSTVSFSVLGRSPTNVATASGTTAANTGQILLRGGAGGNTTIPTTGTGGTGGGVNIISGAGGNAASSTTNSTGGAGGAFTFTGGRGGNDAQGVSFNIAATNAATGGTGGGFAIAGGAGGEPSSADGVSPTNTIGGSGGAIVVSGGAGASPSLGWAAKGGNGGLVTYLGGAGGSSSRTNGGSGGSVGLTGGAAGGAFTGASAGAPGSVSLTGGAGGNGNAPGTNSDGASVFIAGGAPGSGARPGDVVLARTSGGVTRGAGVQVGPLLGGSATVTNILGAAAALDFPSTAAGTISDLIIPVTGVTSNNCAVALSVAWMGAAGGGSFSTYSSNDSVYVRFVNNNLVTAIDPTPFVATVVVFRIR